MKNTTPAKQTLRFRRWSRKAYAAFASIGRCVTIGCLRKSVADSSLSKQKSVTATEYTRHEAECAWPIESVTETAGHPHVLCKAQLVGQCTGVAMPEDCTLKLTYKRRGCIKTDPSDRSDATSFFYLVA